MPLFDAFLKAGSQAGYKFNSDYNGEDQEGFVWTQHERANHHDRREGCRHDFAGRSLSPRQRFH
jgi:choline dehydrogenase-like flavoprotein